MEIKTSSDLHFNGKIALEQFNNSIKEFDLIGTLMSLQKLSALMSNQVWVNVNLEFEFYSTQKIRNRAGMLTRDFVSFFTKQTLLNCRNSNIQYNDLDLVNLIHYYGNLETDLNYIDPKSDSAWLWPIRATNQQWSYLRFYSSIIARYKYLFDKILGENTEFANKLDAVLGLNIFDVMKIGTCIFAIFCPREDGRFATAFQIKNYSNTTIENLKSLLTEGNILKFLNIFSITPKKFRTKSKNFELTDSLLKKYEFNLLRRFPVVKTNSKNEDKKYIIPSLADFIYACFEGLYYVLLDKLETSDKNSFFQKMGSAFEKYIGDLIKYNHLDTFSRAVILPEQAYSVNRDQWKSVDWLLISDDYIVQIECKKRKLDNYSRAGLQNGDKEGVESFLKSIAEELDKLITKSEHIKNNKLDKIKYSDQKIINIIVYLDEMFGINEYAKNQIKKQMKKDSDDFYVLGCWEFELLCQQAKNKSQNIVDSLQDIIKKRDKIYHIDFLDKIYHDFFKDMGYKHREQTMNS